MYLPQQSQAADELLGDRNPGASDSRKYVKFSCFRDLSRYYLYTWNPRENLYEFQLFTYVPLPMVLVES